LSSQQRFSIARQKLFGAKTEDDKWLVLFGLVSHLTVGLPEAQRRALLMAGIWRLAKSNVQTLSRRKRVESVLSIGHDVAAIVGDSLPGFSRLDADRIAVDAFHMLQQEAFKRKRAWYAADDN
jgi:hypothetical protein